MYEVGDKIVCMNPNDLGGYNFYGLKLHKTYTIIKLKSVGFIIDCVPNVTNIYPLEFSYSDKRFIPLSKFRNLKLNKIKILIHER